MRSVCQASLLCGLSCMPDPERLLRTLQQAARAFRDTPGRVGHVLYPTNATEVLVVGDLHGNVENFRKILERAQLASHPSRHLVVQEVVHGTLRYPAGGDKSHQLLDLVAALKCQYPDRVHLVLGNHELSQWTARTIGKGDIDYNAIFREGVGTAYGPLASKVYAAYLELFSLAPLALRTANRVFLSHSLPSRSKLEGFQLAILEKDLFDADQLVFGGAVHSLVWGRDTRLETVEAFLRKVDADLLITGHIPCESGYETPNERQLILDAQGALACYCLFPTDRPLVLQDLVSCVGTL